MVIILLCPLDSIGVVSSLHPGVIEYFRNGYAVMRDKHQHTLDQVLGILRDGTGVLEVTLENQSMEVLQV